MAGAIVLSGGVPELMFAWRLSQAVIMATHISHEIDASRLKLAANVRFGNPTDINLTLNYSVLRFFHHQNLVFTASRMGESFRLFKGGEKHFNLTCVEILRQSFPDLFMEYEAKGTVYMTAEIKTLINEKIPCIWTTIVRI